MPIALIFDIPSMLKISLCDVDETWFGIYGVPDGLSDVKKIEIDNMIYLLRNFDGNESDPIVVINTDGPHSTFRDDGINRYVFDRIATITRSIFTGHVVVPFNWHQHNEGSIGSVYIATKYVGGGSRFHFDKNPAGTDDLFVFARTDTTVPFNKLYRYDDLFLKVRDRFGRALSTRNRPPAKHLGQGITLRQKLAQGFTPGASLYEWYNSKLTDEQRAFVDKPYNGPVRLRGTAGTGKTLSLAIKFLFDGCNFENTKKKRRLCLITHSSGTVDSVKTICEMLDPIGLTFRRGEYVELQIRTIYDLAFEYLRFDLDQLKPLSLDGREGRVLQAELIESILKQMLANSVLTARYANLSDHIKEGWIKHGNWDSRFVAEIMNEFASVLDADGVWANTEKGERYVKGTLGYRPVYLLTLPLEQDRRFMLDIHRQYRRLLAQMKTLSVDQMVADFNSFLDRNAWDQIKESKGFDALFVDELHLFTSTEREVLHKLLRTVQMPDGDVGRPSIFMAYDIKQSPRDTFTQISERDPALFSISNHLQNSDLIRLSKVFRYTPQIAEFLADLDASFPALNMAGEWDEIDAKSQLEGGDKPELRELEDQTSLVRMVFNSALADARQLGGRRVAILCVNDIIFDQYAKIAAGRYPGRIIEINSRESTPDLTHAGKKAILSMPEYVAGLQFDTVYLLHVDAADSPKEMSVGDRRRYVSAVYLGASRAERILKIFVCAERGGPAPLLDLAVQRKSLMRVGN
jgi:hypothetical protein